MKLTMVSIMVEDPMKAFKYYTEVLGFNARLYMPEHYLAIVTAPDDKDGAGILLEPRGNLGSREFYEGIYKANMPVMVFGTNDIQAEYEAMKAKGVRFRGEPKKTDWGWEAIFEDESGNLLQLAQIP